MKKNQILENNEEIVKVRQDFIWYYIDMYLDDLKGTGAMADDKFRSLYNELTQYVSEKCATGIDGDLSCFYIVAEILPKRNLNL